VSRRRGRSAPTVAVKRRRKGIGPRHVEIIYTRRPKRIDSGNAGNAIEPVSIEKEQRS